MADLVQSDVTAGENVLVVDDLLATGGTAKAASALLTGQGAKVAGYAFIIELVGLGGSLDHSSLCLSFFFFCLTYDIRSREAASV